MKKRFTGIFLCLLLSFAFVLTGCDLFPRNMKQYLEKSVCTLTYNEGKKDEKVYEITTEEFINAFNSYGSNLLQNGTPYDKATEQTVEVLIARKVLINHAKSLNITPNEDDKKDFYDEVYENLVSSLNSYAEKVRKDWGLEQLAPQQEQADGKVVYTPYQTKATVVKVTKDGTEYPYNAYMGEGENKVEYNYKIKVKVEDKKQSTNFESLESVLTAFKAYSNPTDTTNNAKIRKESYRRLVSALKRNEEGFNLSKDNDDLVKRYAERLYRECEDNFYIEAVQDQFKEDELYPNKDYSTISVEQVLNRYKALMFQSKYKYETNNSVYDTDMLENFKDVNYVKDDNYFFVSHILVKFSEEQQKEYDSLKDNSHITELVRQQRMKELISGLQATPRDSEGNLQKDQKISATQLLIDLQNALSNAHSEEEKAEVFKTFMYKYGEDPGVQNAEYMYVIGKETSKMVESFTNASRELNKKGVFGEITELVPSEYGAHIIFYGGKVENLFTINDMETFVLEDDDIVKLIDTKLNVLNNKTVFDKVFEMLNDDGYSIFENMQLNVLKKGIKIEKHKSVLDNIR